MSDANNDKNQKNKKLKKYKNMNDDDEKNNHKYENYYVGYNNQNKKYKISHDESYDEESLIIQNKFFVSSTVRPVYLNEMTYFNGLFICETPVFIQYRLGFKLDKYNPDYYERRFFVLHDKLFNLRKKIYKRGRKHKKYYLNKYTKVNINSVTDKRGRCGNIRFEYFLVRIVTRYYKVYIKQQSLGRALQIKNEIIRKIKRIKLGV